MTATKAHAQCSINRSMRLIHAAPSTKAESCLSLLTGMSLLRNQPFGSSSCPFTSFGAQDLWNDPFLSAELDMLSDPFFSSALAPMTGTTQRISQPRVPINVAETPEVYKVTAEIPGYNKDEISADVIGRTLTIKGEHKEEEQKSENENMIRCERRRSRSFERSVRLPVDLDAKKVAANLNNGMLEVTVPKTEPSVEGRVPIEIK